jgi:hypothetical protein
MKLPTYTATAQLGEYGITIIKKIVENDFKWVFRKNHQEHDFGIDAFIDIISEVGQLTGKTIALQIKTGLSYFNENTQTGWIFRGQIEHLNYYLNHDIPVIIIIVNNDSEKAYWSVCDPNKTNKAGENWKMEIPSNQQFNITSKAELLKYISPVRDYVSQLEHFWELNKLLLENNRVIFVTDKSDIIRGDYSDIVRVIERLQVNPDLIKNLNNKIDLTIDGYDDDSRELYEVPEVISWVGSILNVTNGLSYFLATDKAAVFLRLMQYVKLKYKVIGSWIDGENGKKRRQTEIDLSSGKPFLDHLLHDLNTFCEKHNIPIETNKEITFRLLEYLLGKKLPDDIKNSQ